jgi:signal transduction histidine kinase/DNA-binding NarL/FixJ family response regulator
MGIEWMCFSASTSQLEFNGEIMQDIYLTPASISYLTQSILALTITGYLVYRIRLTPHTTRRPHTAFLIGFFAFITLFSLLLFLEASLPRGEDLYALFPQNTALGGALVLLLQFAYRFPALPPRKKWEARLVLGLSIAYTLFEFQFAVHRFQLLGAGQVIWRPEYADYLLAICLLWVPVMFVRQAVHASDPLGSAGLKRLCYVWHPQGRDARAARALALVYLIPFGLSLINLLAGFYVVSRTLYHASMSLGILIGLATFAVVYLDHLPETTSFIVKLVGVTLMALLAVLGTVGWVIAPIYATQYRPVLPDQRTMRFAPNVHSGYDVTEVPFHFERELGVDLQLTDTPDRWAVGLDFAFTFYGQTYRRIYVSNDGVISLGQNVRYTYLHYRYGGGAPIIFPMFLDLSPIPGSGGVFVRQDDGRLIVTWDRIPSFYWPEAVFTFQLILYPDGVFEITYDGLPEHLTYRPNDEPGASPWVVGAVPGDPLASSGETSWQRPQTVDFAALPLESDARGIVQDYQLGFRRHLHQLLASLAYLIIGSSVLVVVGFPILLYTNLVRPLNALLEGLQQMNAGRYDASVNVQYPDEIGSLTQSFNTMSAKLGGLIYNLEARVTERTQALEAARQEAERANLAKSVFLTNMSHELRTPLNAILGFSQLIARQKLSSDQRDNLDIIRRSGEHLLTLINQVLDLSKIETGRSTLDETEFDLYRLLNGLEDMFSLKADDKHLQLILDRGANVPQYVRADEVKLRQVLINLLNNALKFTEKGSVSLKVECGRMKGEKPSEQPDPSSCTLYFSIIDTGPGIATDEMDDLFEAFVQTETGRRVQEGTGLGLPISRQFVQLMGGEMTVSSNAGHGATFTFDVVVGVVEASAVESKALDRRVIALEPDQPHYRILVVDDRWENRQLLLKLLAPLGFALQEASNGREAIEIWETWQPHLIWMDIRMPIMDGYTAIKHIKSRESQIETVIIAMTASAWEDERAAVLATGCDGFLRKPFREADVFELMRQHLGVRYIYDEPVAPLVPTETGTCNLSILPPELLARLEKATDSSDMGMIDNVIAEIRTLDAALADTFASLAHDFEYDEILSLIRAVESKK